MAIDLFAVCALGVFAILGFLSGFWMQLMRLGALVAAALLSGPLGDLLGPRLAPGLGTGALLAKAIGGLLAFVVVYLVLSTVGWAVLRRLRQSKDPEKQKRRARWDSWLGAGFGATKIGLILFVLLCGVVLAEKPLAGLLQRMDIGYRESLAVGLARSHNLLAGLQLPLVGDMARLSRLSSDPEMARKLAADPKVRQLLDHPKVRELFQDKALQRAAENGDLGALLGHGGLNRALSDPEIQRMMSEIEFDEAP